MVRDIYLGDGMRPRDAKTITLKDGAESNGNNIEIPLAKLHSISGTVLSLETGTPVDAPHVELHNADDDSLDTATDVSSASGQFRFPFVVEGEYTLKVTRAEDLPVACIDCAPHPGDDDPLRAYAGCVAAAADRQGRDQWRDHPGEAAATGRDCLCTLGIASLQCRFLIQSLSRICGMRDCCETDSFPHRARFRIPKALGAGARAARHGHRHWPRLPRRLASACAWPQ